MLGTRGPRPGPGRGSRAPGPGPRAFARGPRPRGREAGGGPGATGCGGVWMGGGCRWGHPGGCWVKNIAPTAYKNFVFHSPPSPSHFSPDPSFPTCFLPGARVGPGAGPGARGPGRAIFSEPAACAYARPRAFGNRRRERRSTANVRSMWWQFKNRLRVKILPQTIVGSTFSGSGGPKPL